MRLPVASTLGIEEFNAGEITVPVSRLINGVFLKRSDDRAYITQRPSIDIDEDASATVTEIRGRGVFYWSAVDALYFVNDHRVYKGDYSTQVTEAAVTVSNIDGDGSTATCTATAHGYATGDKITIAGSTSFNGEQAITVNSANEFEFAHASSNTGESGTATRSLGGGGTERVFFFELGDDLAIIDPQDNKGWYIASGASTTLVEITDTDFPGHLASKQLARGGAVLDGTLYVMDTTGIISGSDVEDVTTWGALNIIDAEIEKDGGVWLGKHLNHVVAGGNRTIEFFYDAANPTGSPLAVRQDVSHEIGGADHATVWADQNLMFFVGQTATGGLAVYMMDSFMPRKVSTSDLDTFLTSSVQTDGKQLVGSGFSTGSGVFYILTVYQTNTDIEPLESLVYNPVSGTWTPWELMHTGIDDCPVMDWTVATSTRLGRGILANGDIVTAGDDFSPYDSVNATDGVFEDGVFEQGVFTGSAPGSGDVILMELVTGDSDYDSPNKKTMSSLRLLGPTTEASQALTVQWSDESNQDYNAGRTLDTSVNGQRINRLGRFNRRNFKMTYAGTEKIEIEGFDVELQELAH